MVLPVWQPIGSSSHRLAHTASEMLGEPVTHTGTLDPLASGVLVLLTGEDRYIKGVLPNWSKTYTFEILWSVATDSGDKLGLITDVSTKQVILTELQECLTHFPMTYTQKQHPFSAKRTAGTSFFSLAKTSKKLPSSFHTVSLSGLRFDGSQQLTVRQLLAQQGREISQVDGDFRQQQILHDWQTALTSVTQEFLVTSHSVTTSPRTYIRQLVLDIATELQTPACAWSITRTQNGPFTSDDCLDLTELAELKHSDT